MSVPTGLPVADQANVRRAGVALVRADRTAFIVALALNVLAAAAGLVAPSLVGAMVNVVQAGGGLGRIDRLAIALVAAAVVQLLLGWYARTLGYRFGERTSARLREQLVDRVLALPARVVERAATGDLTSRATTDVGKSPPSCAMPRRRCSSRRSRP